MKNIFNIIIILTSLILISSCASNGEKKDTSELYAKSQTRGAIIERSGTTMGGDATQASRDLRIQDAENRLRSGGGLFGKTGGINLLGGNEKNQTTSIGMPINPYLWKASLETIDFMPIASADPFAGMIITDWYSQADVIDERCKLNIYIKGVELKTSNLKVNSFCQKLSSSNNWVSNSIDTQTNTKLENTILNKAKKIKLTQN